MQRPLTENRFDIRQITVYIRRHDDNIPGFDFPRIDQLRQFVVQYFNFPPGGVTVEYRQRIVRSQFPAVFTGILHGEYVLLDMCQHASGIIRSKIIVKEQIVGRDVGSRVLMAEQVGKEFPTGFAP